MENYNVQKNRTSDNEKKRKRNRIINIVIYTVAALLLVFAVILLLREFVFIPDQSYIDPNEVVEGQTFAPINTPVSDYEKIPVKLNFMKDQVTCDIAAVGIDENRVMESVDSAHVASWLSVDPYVIPGDVGNAVIGGHNLWRGEAGTFSLLKSMQLGDTVAVCFDDGEWRYFEVIDLYECSYDDTACMATDVDEAILTLITCKGDWSPEHDMSMTRVVVVCKYVTSPGA